MMIGSGYMKLFRHVVSLALACALSASSNAQEKIETSGTCVYPTKPIIANGNTATEAEMIKSQQDLKAYISLGRSFIECLDKESGANHIVRHNSAVDEMNAIAEIFNASLKAYQTRTKLTQKVTPPAQDPTLVRTQTKPFFSPPSPEEAKERAEKLKKCTPYASGAETEWAARAIMYACFKDDSILFKSDEFNCAIEAGEAKTEIYAKQTYSQCIK
jgi:hypothetical protein